MTPAQKAAATRAARRVHAPTAAPGYIVGAVPLPSAYDSRPVLVTAQAVYNHVSPMMADAQREIFRVLCLDPRQRLIADIVASVGTVDSCTVDPREVFAPAVVAKATAIILCHNHPSGDPTPSQQDIHLTSQLRAGAELLCMRVFDHVIVSRNGKFTSMAALNLVERRMF